MVSKLFADTPVWTRAGEHIFFTHDSSEFAEISLMECVSIDEEALVQGIPTLPSPPSQELPRFAYKQIGDPLPVVKFACLVGFAKPTSPSWQKVCQHLGKKPKSLSEKEGPGTLKARVSCVVRHYFPDEPEETILMMILALCGNGRYTRRDASNEFDSTKTKELLDEDWN